MKLQEAYDICDKNIITESSVDDIIKLYNRIKNGQISEKQALNIIKSGSNYTDLKNDNEKPKFIVNGLKTDTSNWIKEFGSHFDDGEERNKAVDFFKKVLKCARDRIPEINKLRRELQSTAHEKSQERHNENISKIKTNVEFHGYGK